jgi:hypothetical protein
MRRATSRSSSPKATTKPYGKTEYKKALAREQKEARTVMLPLIVGAAEIPDFLEDKIYIDLRTDYFTGIFNLVAMVRGLSRFRASEALGRRQPQSLRDVWDLLESIGFEPYVVLGRDDFDEILNHGGDLIREDFAQFDPHAMMDSPNVSDHVKALAAQLL